MFFTIQDACVTSLFTHIFNERLVIPD